MNIARGRARCEPGHGAGMALPLIGGGDWNDGFNRVGQGGEGESVWLGWFLHAALNAFIQRLPRRAMTIQRASRWRSHARQTAHRA